MGDLDARKQWKQYQQAYEDLLNATSTPWAPWTVVPADSKTHRNLMIATRAAPDAAAARFALPAGRHGPQGTQGCLKTQGAGRPVRSLPRQPQIKAFNA